ncbi:mechanosensitive ion channel family protein [Castellaniella hirudinis]|uniref:mechanosensitive ion channel family protein n=1 Tax=Castellaniella hirudinis TaxID=1144617 RepID=UPI0039C313B7
MEQELTEFIDKNIWIFPIVTLLITLVINRFVHWFCKNRLHRLQSSRHVWRYALFASINAPLRTAIWLLSLEIIRQKMLPRGKQPLLDQFISPTIDILSIVLLVWFVLRFVESAKANYLSYIQSQQYETDETAIDALSKVAWACVLIFAAIAIMQQLNVPLASLLAFGGAAGIAAGFAAQTLVANLLGGLTIYASRIFKIGEDIVFPGTDLAGTVQHIGWRATKVLGWNGKPLYVPNALFNSSNMVNHSRLSHRMVNEYIQLRYEDYDKVRDIIRDGNHFLEQQSNLKYFVFQFDSFGDRSLKLLLYAWVQTAPPGKFVPFAEFMKAKQALMLGLADIALSHGCTLILPVNTVHLHEMNTPPDLPPTRA